MSDAFDTMRDTMSDTTRDDAFELTAENPAFKNAAVEEKKSYVINDFEGPLDLLLYFIKKHDINIYDIPIAQITEQFLQYIEGSAQVFSLAALTDFYVMAAELLYIKSRMLLPLTDSALENEDLDDPRQELVDKLIEYQKFKKLSALIGENADDAEWSFERKKTQHALPFAEEEVWEKADSWDLLVDMQKVFKQLVLKYSSEKILGLFEEISINEKLTLLNEKLAENGECFFTDLIVRQGNILDIVCAFMAVLEAVKFKMVLIYQNRLFGDIKICASDKPAA
ncbi:MAG: segregation/condensation protein A [Treponemataceae bacterium]|nr:MAG: segregation/condensation protein A [Treponemataceae bacterium]